MSILRGLKERYEVHHGVRLQDAALVSAAQLSHRYIADRFLPDKAIDLVDEAAAKLNIEVSSTMYSKAHWDSLLNLLSCDDRVEFRRQGFHCELRCRHSEYGVRSRATLSCCARLVV